jgi:carboxypeptidase family protein
MNRLRSIVACSLVGCVAFVAAASPALAQTAQSFRYVFPKFNSNFGTELIIANLSSRLATPEITMVDTNTGTFSDVFVNLQAGTQARLTSRSLGLSSFEGSVLVTSSVQLSVVSTIVDLNGSFETLGGAATSTDLILPFGPGVSGNADVTIFNGENAATSVVVSAVDSNGTIVAIAQRTIQPFGTFTENTLSLFPQAPFSAPRNISHLVVRATTNVFGSQRRIYAQAVVRGFSDPIEGIVTADPGTSTGIASSSASLTASLPFFSQGGGYSTMVQIINTSASTGTVRLTARGPDGNALDGTPVLQVRAGGSIRQSVQNIFNLTSPGMVTGSITVESTVPVIVAEGITTVAQGGLAIVPAAGAADTNFVYRVNRPNASFFTGLTFSNPSANTATIVLRDILEDGTADSQMTFSLLPFTSSTRVLTEFLPEVRSNGLLHVSSDRPILVSGLEGRSDLTGLGNLAATHSQPDYNAPNPTRFQITGTVRHNGVPFAGVNVQLSGTINASVTTDAVGTYFFPNTPPGSYLIRPAALGYSFSPTTLNVNVTDQTSRNNDFAATLITPVIQAITPTSIVAGSPSTQISLGGGPFNASSVIVFEGNALPTALGTAAFPVQIVGATGAISTVFQTMPALTATLNAQSLAVPHASSVAVVSTGPGGSVASAPSNFTIGSPAPVLTALGTLPIPLIAGNPGFTTTVTGTGFLPGAVITINGTPRPTVLQNVTTASVTIPPEDLATGARLKVAALNPAPTVGPSNALDLAVMNPTPGVTAISPMTTEVKLEPNAPPLSLNVVGFGFKPGATILLGAVEVPTTYGNSSSLLGTVPASALLVGGVFPVSVKNPDPSVAQSEALPLNVNNLLPVLSSIYAGPLTFDDTRTDTYAAPIILTGSNFGPNSVVEVSPPCSAGGTFGTASAQYISSHQLIATVTIGCSGDYLLRVKTPQPGGGISSIFDFLVDSAAEPVAPVITSLSPTAVAAGSGTFTLTITGGTYLNGAVVSFGSAVLFPTAVSSTQITVTVPGYLVTAAGSIPITVTNPGPTGGSNRVLFTVF